MRVTRFSPTVNGRLHIGHLYLILLNAEADRFIVRFDDCQSYFLDTLGQPKIDEYIEGMKEDLDWLGIKPDAYTYKSREKAANEALFVGKLLCAREDVEVGVHPKIVHRGRPFGYDPYFTAVTVAQDYREGCNTLIRGEDLISQFCLYCYFCRLLDIPVPEFVYVPKLTLVEGRDEVELITSPVPGSTAELTGLSKTAGTHKIQGYRNEGWTPAQLVTKVAHACLIDPKAGWRVENVKPYPRLFVA